MSRETAARRAVTAVALTVLLAGFAGGSLRAGEATARGRNARVIWLDEKGERHEVAGKEIRYGYFIRVYLKVPKDGRNYRDEEHQDKGLPFAEDFIRFSTMERIDFARETDPESGAERLRITVTPPKGKPREGRAASLAGATHPDSPFIEFRLDGVPHRIELLPLAPADQRRGKPELISLDFSL